MTLGGGHAKTDQIEEGAESCLRAWKRKRLDIKEKFS